MFVMIVSEQQYQALWNKLQPTERHSVPTIPIRTLLFTPLNLLVMVDTIVASAPPKDEEIMIAGLVKYLTAAKVAHKLTL